MTHIILAETYQEGREFALTELGVDPRNITCGIGVAVICADDQYMRICTVSRDPTVTKIHELVPASYFPRVRSVLQGKGLL